MAQPSCRSLCFRRRRHYMNSLHSIEMMYTNTSKPRFRRSLIYSVIFWRELYKHKILIVLTTRRVFAVTRRAAKTHVDLLGFPVVIIVTATIEGISPFGQFSPRPRRLLLSLYQSLTEFSPYFYDRVGGTAKTRTRVESMNRINHSRGQAT
jgi:hypothetical protein